MTELEYSWGRLQEVKLQDRSVSQLKEYLDQLGGCSYKYFLNRVVRAWDMPAAWLPQGLGVHEAAEFWERSYRTASRDKVLDRYRESYIGHYRRLAETTPNLDYWFPSWKYQGWEDVTRRAFKGESQILNYLTYYQNNHLEIPWLTSDGELAVELRFDIKLGDVKVIGYIDSVIQVKNTLRVRDIKTGKNPGETLQLKVYDLAVEKQYGAVTGQGDYFMAEKGKPTKPYDLTQMTESQVTDLFRILDTGVKNESFDPSPEEDKCRMCPVRAACKYREG